MWTLNQTSHKDLTGTSAAKWKAKWNDTPLSNNGADQQKHGIQM